MMSMNNKKSSYSMIVWLISIHWNVSVTNGSIQQEKAKGFHGCNLLGDWQR